MLGAGAVHGLCVAALLPMLITLPGPGSNAPPAIDVEVLKPAAVLPKHAADPATTSALPRVEASPAEPRTEQARPEDAARPATAQPIEVPPDDMPQQTASPDAPAPSGIHALTPEPLMPTLMTSQALAPPPPEEVKQVTLEPDITTTSSIVPVATNPEAETLGEAEAEASAPPAPPLGETPEPKPEPEVVRANPNEETPQQGAPEEDAAEAEIPGRTARCKAGGRQEARAANKAEGRGLGQGKSQD